jgi:parallel beta-helix repeat protein
MRTSARIAVAVAVLLLLAGLGALAWWQQSRQAAPGQAAGTLAVSVTSPADRGPGTLREALFLVAAANGKADLLLRVKTIAIETLLPPLINAHGVRVIGATGGTEIYARALSGGPLLDVAGDNTSLEGVTLHNCSGTAILLRASHFRLRTSSVDGCDVAVDVAENASDVLIVRNRFVNDRIGVRFAASSRNAEVMDNEFAHDRDAGLWAVRAQPDARDSGISVHDNRFSADGSGVVAANVAVLVEHNDFAASVEAAVHLLGAGARIRGNHISGGPAMGIIVENAREAIIDNNDLDHLAAYGIMVRASANTLVRANRVTDCGYGLAFVLGDPRSPSTAVDNTIIEPHFNGIDVLGDSPILRHNQVLRPHALPLHVSDFQEPDGTRIAAHPFLDGNSFLRADSTVAASAAARDAARRR